MIVKNYEINKIQKCTPFSPQTPLGELTTP